MPAAAHSDPLQGLIQADLARLTALRHDLHAHPEVRYEERRTSQVIQEHLADAGVQYVAGLAGGTGVLAHLPATEGPADARAVALRADIDALPIHERTGRPYASTHEGVMHACGHDGHTAIALGAAGALAKLDRRPHPVTILFQPAEEGGAGGERMVQDGALDGSRLGPPVSRIFGLHGWPELAVGEVASREGPLLAAVDNYVVDVEGAGSHAAAPHLGTDPVVAAAYIIVALQTIASRRVDPVDPVVVTVGAIHGGTADNVIPTGVRLLGTVRTLKRETRAAVERLFHEIVSTTATTHGCRANIAWHPSYPVTVNHPDATREFFEVARRALGGARAHVAESPTMGGEDFSYYGDHASACFFLLGLKPPGAERVPQLHQPDFDFNDAALPLGVELMCRLALDSRAGAR